VIFSAILVGGGIWWSATNLNISQLPEIKLPEKLKEKSRWGSLRVF